MPARSSRPASSTTTRAGSSSISACAASCRSARSSTSRDARATSSHATPRRRSPRSSSRSSAARCASKILEVNRKANRLILSEKVALYEERREKRDELFSSLETGQRVTGVVRSIAPFGVFVDLGGIDGLVHKSELSWNKVNNPETAHQIGDEVEAEVIDINHERGRISLSIRRLQPDPWQESVAKYKIGDVIDGTVTKLVNFGAFVRVEEGLEGLIHISELSHQRVAHPGDVVQEGQEVKLRIISLDSERHRLGLSLKQAEDRPAPAPREERPRRDRPPRRDRFEYRPEDATAEPEGGIDNTMAAAFAIVGPARAVPDVAGRRGADGDRASPPRPSRPPPRTRRPRRGADRGRGARGQPPRSPADARAEEPAAAEEPVGGSRRGADRGRSRCGCRSRARRGHRGAGCRRGRRGARRAGAGEGQGLTSAGLTGRSATGTSEPKWLALSSYGGTMSEVPPSAVSIPTACAATVLSAACAIGAVHSIR